MNSPGLTRATRPLQVATGAGRGSRIHRRLELLISAALIAHLRFSPSPTFRAGIGHHQDKLTDANAGLSVGVVSTKTGENRMAMIWCHPALYPAYLALYVVCNDGVSFKFTANCSGASKVSRSQPRWLPVPAPLLREGTSCRIDCL